MIPSMFKTEITFLVKKGFTPSQIAKKLKLNKSSTYSYIKSNFNIKYSRTYKIDNPDYFKKIDTYMKAYWLGFICADGYLVEDKGSFVVGIQLSIKDIEILENFKNYLKSEKPIQIINKVNKDLYQTFARLHIGNKQMFKDLVNLGITPKKSLTLQNILKNIPYKYRDSFIIGYHDGDGSVILPKGKIKQTTNKWYPSHSTNISIRGTKELLEAFKLHLNINTKLVYNKTYVLNINTKKDVIRFLKCYNNLNFFLGRKFNKLITRLNHSSYNKFIQAQTISSPYPYKET